MYWQPTVQYAWPLGSQWKNGGNNAQQYSRKFSFASTRPSLGLRNSSCGFNYTQYINFRMKLYLKLSKIWTKTPKKTKSRHSFVLFIQNQNSFLFSFLKHWLQISCRNLYLQSAAGLGDELWADLAAIMIQNCTDWFTCRCGCILSSVCPDVHMPRSCFFSFHRCVPGFM